jgi:hypothetical protein
MMCDRFIYRTWEPPKPDAFDTEVTAAMVASTPDATQDGGCSQRWPPALLWKLALHMTLTVGLHATVRSPHTDN